MWLTIGSPILAFPGAFEERLYVAMETRVNETRGCGKGLTQVGRGLCEWGGTEHETQPTRGRGRRLILRTGLRIPLTLEEGREREREGGRRGEGEAGR